MSRFFAVTAFSAILSAQHECTLPVNSLARDPLRSSAGGAKPKPATSDALCRPAALTRELHLPRSPSRHLALRRGNRTLPPRQSQSHVVGLRTTRTSAQDAFGRIESQPCD
jgi:hypothetical protein